MIDSVSICYEKSRVSGFGHYYRSKVLKEFFKSLEIKIQFFERKNIDKFRPSNILYCDFLTYNLSKYEKDSLLKFKYLISLEAYDSNINFDDNIFIFDKSFKTNNELNLLNALIRSSLEFSEPICSKEQFIILGLSGASSGSRYKNIIENIRLKGFAGQLVVLSNKNLQLNLSNVKIHIRPKNVDSLLSSCSGAICDPGLIMLELLALKKNVYGVSNQFNHDTFLRYLINKKWVLPFDKIDDLKSKCMKNPIDFQGAKRIWERTLKVV